jgi:tRNA nucleotidyltransferase (CCA-adding enzyme)
MSETGRVAAPASAQEAKERLVAANVPREILAVATELRQAGHAAVLVGGCVRDVLIGRAHADWDLATSARPEEVQALFRRTIPTGVEHGTVTVMVGKGERRSPVEVTTFRGEGQYHDGRRPSEVRFLRDLEEDLARRDFTINAFAWDPVDEVFTDAFDGLGDLNGRVVRAVGAAVERFREDGLRTMRAVRFCATLGFGLHANTEGAIEGALDVFDKVSRERVRVELVKLLGASKPSLGLLPMARTGLWPRVLPELDPDDRGAAIQHVDVLGEDPVLRLARLVLPARNEGTAVAAALDRLTLSRAERARLDALTSAFADQVAVAEDPIEIRRAAVRLKREHVEDVLTLNNTKNEVRRRVIAALDGVALTKSELAIKGRDLIESGIVKAGPEVGKLLDALFESVIQDPTLNEREALLARARSTAS